MCYATKDARGNTILPEDLFEDAYARLESLSEDLSIDDGRDNRSLFKIVREGGTISCQQTTEKDYYDPGHPLDPLSRGFIDQYKKLAGDPFAISPSRLKSVHSNALRELCEGITSRIEADKHNGGDAKQSESDTPRSGAE